MAKVFGMHMIVLHPGVEEEDFEKFMAELMPKMSQYEGWRGYLLKGDRGDREGKYLWMVEIPSVESRDRFMPSHNVASEEARQLEESLSEEEKEWRKEMFGKYANFSPSVVGDNTVYTDYVVIADSG